MLAENMICFLDDNFESLSQFGRISDNTKLDKGITEALRVSKLFYNIISITCKNIYMNSLSIQALAEVENQTKITKQEQLRTWAIKLFKKKKNKYSEYLLIIINKTSEL